MAAREEGTEAGPRGRGPIHGPRGRRGRTFVERFERSMGAGLLVLAFALGAVVPATAVAPLGKFGSATSAVSWSVTHSGCSVASISRPALSLSTGLGHVVMKAKARTCSPIRGGSAVPSKVTVTAGLGVTESIKLGKAASSVAISWDVLARASTNATTHFRTCPNTTSSSSYPIYIGSVLSTWAFNNVTVANCAAESDWQVYMNPEVYDVTTGRYYSTFASMTNTSGNYFDFYRDTTNYSNASYSNTSFSSTYAHVFGGAALTNLSWSPTAYLNGTYRAGDRLIVYANLFVIADAFIESEGGAHAVTAVDAGGTVGHVDLIGIVIR